MSAPVVRDGLQARRVLLVGAAACSVLLALSALLLLIVCYLPRQTAPDVTVDGIGLRGLNRDEVLRRLKEAPPRSESVIWEAGALPLAAEVRLAFAAEQVMEAVFAHGRTGTLGERLGTWWRSRPGEPVPPVWTAAEGEVERIADWLGPLVSSAPVSAERKQEGDRVWIEPDLPGRALDRAALAEQVRAVARGERRFAAPVVEVAAPVTAESLRAMGIEALRGKATTYFDPGNRPRSHNLLLAAQTIGTRMLAPGETFSYNQVVGERTMARGYQVAKVILGDALVPGLGGGICQVSSTIYVAALKAGVTVVDRTNHSLVVSYLSPGLDATVSWGGPEFVLRNDTDKYLLLSVASEAPGSITARFFGPAGGNFALEPVVLARFPAPVHVTQDPTLPAGQMVVEQEGQPGTKAALYRNAGGARELVNISWYSPVPHRVRHGTKPPDPPPPAKPDAGDPQTGAGESKPPGEGEGSEKQPAEPVGIGNQSGGETTGPTGPPTLVQPPATNLPPPTAGQPPGEGGQP